MKDYLNTYGNKTPKFQEGGAMQEPAAAPQQQGPDVEGMLQQYAQQPSPELAVAICDSLVAMMGAAQGGAPEGGAPMPAAANGMRMGGAPKFRKGGKL